MHLVMFDIDGTLVDSTGFDAELFSSAVREVVGIEVDENWSSYTHVTDSGILGEILERSVAENERAVAYEQVKRRFVTLMEDFVPAMPSGLSPIPGAVELVHLLKTAPQVAVAIATGGWRETAELKLRAVGIEFDGLPFATSSDLTSRAEIMRLAERRAGALGPFSRKTYFGDAPWDLEATRALGYDFVAVGERVEHSCRFSDLRDLDTILGVLQVGTAGDR